MPTKKKTDEEEPKKAAKAPAKKAAVKTLTKKASKKKDVEGVRSTEAEVRTSQEEGSIAPPTSNLFPLSRFSKRPSLSLKRRRSLG